MSEKDKLQLTRAGLINNLNELVLKIESLPKTKPNPFTRFFADVLDHEFVAHCQEKIRVLNQAISKLEENPNSSDNPTIGEINIIISAIEDCAIYSANKNNMHNLSTLLNTRNSLHIQLRAAEYSMEKLGV